MFKSTLLVVVMLSVSSQLALAGSTERSLLAELFTNYNKVERPVMDEHTPVEVSVGLSLQQIIGYEEDKETFTSVGSLNMRWNDYSLTWQPSKYNGIASLKVPSSKLWIPDILLLNSASNRFDPRTEVNAVLYSNGTVVYTPPSRFETFCPHKLNNDVLVCTFKFGSGTYDETQLNVVNVDFHLDEYLFEEKTWKRINSVSTKGAKKYTCCPENYPYAEFDIHLKKMN